MILLQLFWSFLQIGLFSFGGGYAAMRSTAGSVWRNSPTLSPSRR